MRQEITPQALDSYINSFLRHPHPVMDEMAKEANRRSFPHIGQQVGQLLFVLTRMMGAKRVFELGSGFGYSAAWFAFALEQKGRVILTDTEERHKSMAQSYFDRMNLKERIDFRVGNALDLLAEDDEPNDIIFNDIDKEQYPLTLELAYERLHPGGLFITDNTLWYGEVLDQNPTQAAEGVQRFNSALFDHPGFRTSLLPVRDGITLSVRL